MTAGPFAALGLPTRPDLTDDDIRAAWRRIAVNPVETPHLAPGAAKCNIVLHLAPALIRYTLVQINSGR